jgi:two-component system sensor histidine kinase PilS (NtrC family)
MNWFGRGAGRVPEGTANTTSPSGSDSWLDALGFREAVRAGGDGNSTLDPRWAESEQGLADSSFLSRQARRMVSADQSAHRRVYATYLTARAVLGVVLALSQGVIDLLGGIDPGWLLVISGAYAVQALFAQLWPEGGYPDSRRRWRWWGTVGVDVLAFGAMHWLEPVATLNHAALLVLPVMMASVLGARLPALATASAVSLLLLATAWRRSMAGGDITALISQAGLAGVGMFVIVLVAGQMASRLAREERTARGSLELAREPLARETLCAGSAGIDIDRR